MRIPALIGLVILLSAAPAFPQDNPACAKFQEPLAYNACLARQGPPARMVRAAPMANTATVGAWRAQGRPTYFRARGGRAHAVFDVR